MHAFMTGQTGHDWTEETPGADWAITRLQGCFYLDYVAFWGIDDPAAKGVVAVGLRVGGAPHNPLGL